MLDRYAQWLFCSGVMLIAGEASPQWQSIGTGGATYSVEVHNGALFAGVQGGSIRRSVDHGDTWTDVNTGITVPSNWWLSSTDGALYCGTQLGSAFRTVDDGATWEDIGLSAARGFTMHNDTLYACQWYGTTGVDWSSDGGDSWNDTQSITGFSGLWPLLSVEGDLLVGGQSGGIARITHSSDAWTVSNTGLVSTEVYSFTRIGDVLFAGTGTGFGSGGGVYRSDDLGQTWTASGMDGFMIYALHSRDSLLFAGTSANGVFLSTDTGATWTAFNDGLSSLQVNRLTSDEEYVYVGTMGALFRYDDLGSAVKEQSMGAVRLSAWPVPCTDAFTLSMVLDGASGVYAQLFDVSGALVTTRTMGMVAPGVHNLPWDVSDLAPGLYTCLVVADGQRQAVRVLKE